MGDQDYLSGPPPTNPFYQTNLPLNQQLSPYLQIDPSIFRESQPQYILPEGAAPRRGAFELMFSQIGGAALAAYIYGMGRGAINASLVDKNMKSLHGAQWRSQCLTHAGNQGKRAAGAVGGIVMMYAIANTIISSNYVRSTDDELNSVLAGAVAGIVYMSPESTGKNRQIYHDRGQWARAVLRRTAMGGVAGMLIAGAFTMLNPQSRHNLGEIRKNMIGF